MSFGECCVVFIASFATTFFVRFAIYLITGK